MHDEALELSYREFEGTEILSGSPETLAEVADRGSINKLLIHFLNPKMWNALRDKEIPGGVTVWVHSYEAQPWWRREVLFETPRSKERAASESEKKMSFWHDVLLNAPSNWHFVFVSDWLAQTFFEEVGISLPAERYSVVHNIVDTDRFSFVEKDVKQRFKVLSIRPFASKIYANDLTVEAILELEKHSPIFQTLNFQFMEMGSCSKKRFSP